MMQPHPSPIVRALLSVAGIALMITLFIFGLYLFFYLILIAFIIGSVLMLVNYVRLKLFNKNSPTHRPSQSTGRVFEHHENDDSKK